MFWQLEKLVCLLACWILLRRHVDSTDSFASSVINKRPSLPEQIYKFSPASGRDDAGAPLDDWFRKLDAKTLPCTYNELTMMTINSFRGLVNFVAIFIITTMSSPCFFLFLKQLSAWLWGMLSIAKAFFTDIFFKIKLVRTLFASNLTWF